jgi:hypothetical protein
MDRNITESGHETLSKKKVAQFNDFHQCNHTLTLSNKKDRVGHPSDGRDNWVSSKPFQHEVLNVMVVLLSKFGTRNHHFVYGDVHSKVSSRSYTRKYRVVDGCGQNGPSLS